jgi:acyl-CoA synthetase (AMP-forming)/AMP-acid ligase II
VLQADARVATAAVLGLPDPRLGQRVVVAKLPRNAISKVVKRELEPRFEA